jgi:hypothetical protein
MKNELHNSEGGRESEEGSDLNEVSEIDIDLD